LSRGQLADPLSRCDCSGSSSEKATMRFN
jgi:hypothetical protein